MGIFKRITSFLVLTLLVVIMLMPAEASASTGVALNSTNFPDETFLNLLKNGKREEDGIRYDSDDNGVLSASEISKITKLNVSYNTIHEDISNLKGIEYLTSLIMLKCQGQIISSLDLSKNVNLTELNCSNNNMTSLNISKNTKLQTIVCNDNKLTSLNLGNNYVLKMLCCSNNELTALDVTKCTMLETLECPDNNISVLNITNNINLRVVACQNNKINLLNFTENHNSLKTVTCQNNAIGRLYFYYNPELSTLNCSNQKISATMYKDGSKKFLNMTAYGINDIKIKGLSSGVTYDDDAQCFVLPNTAARGSVVSYNYSTGHSGVQMDVTITISGEASGKYPIESTPDPTTKPSPTQPPTTQPSTTQPPTTKPSPTQGPITPTQGPITPTTKPQETTPSVVNPTQKPTGQPVTDEQGETKTNPAGEVVTEPIIEPSGEIDGGETTTNEYINPTIDSDDIGPKDILDELKPILIAVIGVVVLIIVVIVVIIIVSGKKNGKTKSKKNDKDKYQYNNRIKY